MEHSSAEMLRDDDIHNDKDDTRGPGVVLSVEGDTREGSGPIGHTSDIGDSELRDRGGRFTSDNDSEQEPGIKATADHASRVKAFNLEVNQHVANSHSEQQQQHHHRRHDSHHHHNNSSSSHHNLSREQTGASVGPPSAPGVSRPPVKDNDALGRRRQSPDKALPVAFSNSVRYVAGNGGMTAAIVALLAVFHNASQL